MFSNVSKITLTKAVITKNAPVYVQFYITSRCNLTCKQCNIRYTNADVRECSLEEIKHIAENFAKIGVAIVLLTGGEPFVRSDLPEIIREFESRGIHVRMQTNGIATEEQIHKCIEYGGKDISISLDSLNPKNQDDINGGFFRSWNRALQSIACFTKYLPKKDSFASLGCVIQPQNLADIPDVIRFGTEIGWYTSLVPIHITNPLFPRGFRTYDQTLRFSTKNFKKVDALLSQVKTMRDEGYLLYDSDQYLEDIALFIRNIPTTWRKKNDGVCDSPNLYFALLPNGDVAPCCDYRLPYAIHSYSPTFPNIYRDVFFRKEVQAITEKCNGCMYGSYPEMTISMRFASATVQRVKTFITSPPVKPWPLTYEQIETVAENIRSKRKRKS